MSRLEFDFVVPMDHPALAGHFPGRPLVPGVLVLDHVLQAVRAHSGKKIVRLAQVKFLSALLPSERAHTSCEVDQERVNFRVTAQRGGQVVVVAQGAGEWT